MPVKLQVSVHEELCIKNVLEFPTIECRSLQANNLIIILRSTESLSFVERNKLIKTFSLSGKLGGFLLVVKTIRL